MKPKDPIFSICIFLLITLYNVIPSNGQCQDDPAYASLCQTLFFNTTVNRTLFFNCNNPVYASLISKCPQSCQLCNQLGYGCNNTLNSTICYSLQANCNNSAFISFMNISCPQTCGFCPISGNLLNCLDVAQNCNQIMGLCNNPATYDLLTQQCGRTCRRCGSSTSSVSSSSSTSSYSSSSSLLTTSVTFGPFTTTPIGGCFDRAGSSCIANANLCSNTFYQQLMTAQCAKTCGRCGVCVDVDNRCPIWVRNGFCTSPYYSTSTKAATCPYSCGLCSG